MDELEAEEEFEVEREVERLGQTEIHAFGAVVAAAFLRLLHLRNEIRSEVPVGKNIVCTSPVT